MLTVEVLEREPHNIAKAFLHEGWRCATQEEYDALIRNQTWELVPLPPGRKAIGCKWLFKIKRNVNGTIVQHKDRLVEKGCSQVLGCDFKKTFSPVVKPATIRVILFIVVSKGWELR